MVVTGLNDQMPDARAFAHRVKAKVEVDAITKNYPIPQITVTGHSLGAAIAEILAYEMRWHGITFNGPLRQGIKS